MPGWLVYWLYFEILYNAPPFTKAYNSVVFSTFTELCNHHHNLILEHLRHSQKKLHIPYPLAVTPCCPIPQPLATIYLLSVSPVLDISCEWNHVIDGSLAFEVHPFCNIYQYFIFFF